MRVTRYARAGLAAFLDGPASFYSHFSLLLVTKMRLLFRNLTSDKINIKQIDDQEQYYSVCGRASQPISQADYCQMIGLVIPL